MRDLFSQGRNRNETCNNSLGSKQLIKVAKECRLGVVPLCAPIGAKKYLDEFVSEHVRNLHGQDRQVDISIRAARMAAVEKSDTPLRIGENIAQRGVPVRDDQILRQRKLRLEAIE